MLAECDKALVITNRWTKAVGDAVEEALPSGWRDLVLLYSNGNGVLHCPSRLSSDMCVHYGE